MSDIEDVKPRTLVAYGLPPVETPVWLAVFNLAFRPWFSRLWVVQEVVLATAATILSGEYQAELDEMASFCNYFRFASFMDDAARQHKFNLGSRSTDNGLSGFPVVSA